MTNPNPDPIAKDDVALLTYNQLSTVHTTYHGAEISSFQSLDNPYYGFSPNYGRGPAPKWDPIESNGRLYAVSATGYPKATAVCDPLTDSLYEIAWPTSATPGIGGYTPPVLAPDGCLYQAPYANDSHRIVKTNTNTDVVTTIDISTIPDTVGVLPPTVHRYAGRGVVADGHIYWAPAVGRSILKLNYTTNVVSAITTPAMSSNNNAGVTNRGGAYLNGVIYWIGTDFNITRVGGNVSRPFITKLTVSSGAVSVYNTPAINNIQYFSDPVEYEGKVVFVPSANTSEPWFGTFGSRGNNQIGVMLPSGVFTWYDVGLLSHSGWSTPVPGYDEFNPSGALFSTPVNVDMSATDGLKVYFEGDTLRVSFWNCPVSNASFYSYYPPVFGPEFRDTLNLPTKAIYTSPKTAAFITSAFRYKHYFGNFGVGRVDLPFFIVNGVSNTNRTFTNFALSTVNNQLYAFEWGAVDESDSILSTTRVLKIIPGYPSGQGGWAWGRIPAS